MGPGAGADLQDRLPEGVGLVSLVPSKAGPVLTRPLTGTGSSRGIEEGGREDVGLGESPWA